MRTEKQTSIILQAGDKLTIKSDLPRPFTEDFEVTCLDDGTLELRADQCVLWTEHYGTNDHTPENRILTFKEIVPNTVFISFTANEEDNTAHVEQYENQQTLRRKLNRRIVELHGDEVAKSIMDVLESEFDDLLA